MMVSNAARFGTEKAAEPLRRVDRTSSHLSALSTKFSIFPRLKRGSSSLVPMWWLWPH